jgi:CHASE3 domain sensor protein
MNQEIPIAIQLTAFSQAICDVLAVPHAEFQVIRELLHSKGVVSEREFEFARHSFPEADFQAIASELNKQVLSKVREIVQKMIGPERVQ